MDVFSCDLVFGTGLKIGRMRYPYGNIEIQIHVPVYPKEKYFSSLFKSTGSPAGIGMKTTLYIPVGKKKIAYEYIKRR